MKKILILLSIFSIALMAQSKAYEACAPSEKEAKANLVTQIVSTMESEFSSTVSVDTEDSSKVSKKAHRKIKSSSRLTLSQVNFFKQGSQVCAQISQDNLIAIAKGKLKVIKHYNLDKLPKDEIALVNYLEERLDEIRQANAIATLLADAFDDQEIKLLEDKYKLLQDERSRHHAQKVSFQITPEEATLLIDGNKQNRHHNIYLTTGTHSYSLELENHQTYQANFEVFEKKDKTITIDFSGNQHPTVTFSYADKATVTINKTKYDVNTPITLTPGEHTYTIDAQGFCPLQGSIHTALGTQQTINVDLTTQAFPQLTINSNQEFAELKIDAASFSMGKTKTFTTCQPKEISYTVTFDKQIQQGTVELKPGLMKTLNVNFLTQLDIRALQAQAASYRDGSRLILRAAYETDPLSMLVYSFDKINQRKWLRYGFGFLYGADDQKSKADIHYTLAMQFTDFGAKEMPLHIGSFALIPFIGVQAGGTFLKEEQQDFQGMAKALAGFDFVLNKFMGFEFSVSKNFLYQEEYSFGIALSLKNPF